MLPKEVICLETQDTPGFDRAISASDWFKKHTFSTKFHGFPVEVTLWANNRTKYRLLHLAYGRYNYLFKQIPIGNFYDGTFTDSHAENKLL